MLIWMASIRVMYCILHLRCLFGAPYYCSALLLLCIALVTKETVVWGTELVRITFLFLYFLTESETEKWQTISSLKKAYIHEK